MGLFWYGVTYWDAIAQELSFLSHALLNRACIKQAWEVQVKVSFSHLKGTRVSRKRIIPSVVIESSPYLSLNCFLELKLNLISVSVLSADML